MDDFSGTDIIKCGRYCKDRQNEDGLEQRRGLEERLTTKLAGVQVQLNLIRVEQARQMDILTNRLDRLERMPRRISRTFDWILEGVREVQEHLHESLDNSNGTMMEED